MTTNTPARIPQRTRSEPVMAADTVAALVAAGLLRMQRETACRAAGITLDELSAALERIRRRGGQTMPPIR